MIKKPYRSLSAFLRERFGQRVQKITLDAGLSCPNRSPDKKGGCIYCNALGSGTGAMQRGLPLKDQIEIQIDFQSKRYNAKAFIAYFQSYTNTYAPVDDLKKIYDCVLPFSEIVGISIGTRPDCVDHGILELIGSYSDKRLVWVEYGLQSSNNSTLELINRGHDTNVFADAVSMSHERGLRTCAHVILGLPGEGIEEWLETARFVSSLSITDIKVHLMYVVRGTILENLYSKGEYKPLELDEYASGVVEFISWLDPGMVIQRITGDPHEEELVAPFWALDKKSVISRIHYYFKELQTYQGKNFMQTP